MVKVKFSDNIVRKATWWYGADSGGEIVLFGILEGNFDICVYSGMGFYSSDTGGRYRVHNIEICSRAS